MISIKNRIIDYISDTHPSGIVNRLVSVNEFWEEIELYSLHMPITNKGEMIYVYLNNQTSIMCQCKTHKRKFISFKMGYSKFCSKIHNKECIYRKRYSKQARELTNLKKYGVKHPTQLLSVQNKKKLTNQKKYGVNNVFQLENIKEKSKKTNIKKYGVKIASKSDIVKEKTRLSNLKIYGVVHPNQLTPYKEKIVETTMKKYGVRSIAELSSVKEKKKATMIRRYGVEYPTQVEKIKKLIVYKQRNAFFDQLESRLNTNVVPLFTKKQYINVSTHYNWKCKDCNTIFADHIDDGSSPRCPLCFPKLKSRSKGECEIGKFIRELGFDILINNRELIKPKELDIVIPEKKLAIEYCGLYWHSVLKGKDDKYHINKMQLTNRIGYKLITIFDYEWKSFQSNVKNKIKNLLGIYDLNYINKQYKLSIIDRKKTEIFIKKYHIFPMINSDINIGIIINNQLIALMSFMKEDINETYIITQFCSIGSANNSYKLIFTYFINEYNPVKVSSCCNLRWGIEKFYELCSFNESYIIKPRCWKYQYNKEYGTSHIIQSYNNNNNKKVDGEIWDCGYKIFTWKKK